MMDASCTHRCMPREKVTSRRGFARRLLGGGLGTVLLATGGRRDTRAQGTPSAAASVSDDAAPPRYMLKGGETEILFEPMTAGGAPRLDYHAAPGSLSFTGSEIDVERNQSLGLTAAVLIETAPDGFVRYLTLLVPDVNPEGDGADVPVQTLAILTTHLTSIGGPALVKGAVQTYEVVALAGVAEFVSA